MSPEEIEHRISEIEKSIISINKLIKSKGFRVAIVDNQLATIKSLIYSEIGRRDALLRWYREYEKKGLVEKAEEELKKVIESEKEKESLKDTRIELYYRRDGFALEKEVLEEEKEELEEELERLKRKIIPPPPPVEVPEFIDIDDATGYLIMYSPSEKAYFKLRPEDYEKGKIEVVKYFRTLEIAVNFTFDTEVSSEYPGVPARTLEAEVRIVARVREAGRELSIAIPEKLKEAFERHITFFFEQSHDRGKGAGTWKGGMKHVIANGVNYTGKHKIEVGKKISEMLGVKVLKVGVFYRINDENPNMLIEEEYARPQISGEWSRQNYSESVSKEFDVEHELGQSLHWSMVRGFVGESGWEQLQCIKKEEEE